MLTQKSVYFRKYNRTKVQAETLSASPTSYATILIKNNCKKKIQRKMTKIKYVE